MENKATVLVVDDEYGVRQSFKMVLKGEYHMLLAGTGKEALDIFSQKSVDIVLLDILLPDIDGLDLLEKLKAMDANTEIIMVTAVKEIQTAVRATKLGAYEYIVKPFIIEDVEKILIRALEKRNLVKEVAYLKDELDRHHPFQKIIGKDEKMMDIFELINALSESEGSVLIEGESGTGKELVAMAIHYASSRRDKPFVVVNCAAIPATLMESTIFGHHKGAFTGASHDTVGKLELAHKGTAFLDDIDTLDISMQAKLLRVIQEKEFEKVGGHKVIKVDVRFVAASNKDIKQLIARGEFREDLFYRLNVFPIRVPALRERKKDIPLLLNHFLELNARKTCKSPKRFSNRAMKVLIEYDWPGNVRELQNLVERLFTISKGDIIHLENIPALNLVQTHFKGLTLQDAMNSFERQYITEVLELVEGNRKSAAELLGIHRNTLLNKINELGIKE